MAGDSNGSAAALIVGFTIQGLAVARALATSGVKVYVVERPHESGRFLDVSPLQKTRHATIFNYDRLIGDDLLDALLDCRRKIPERDVVLFPASDNTVRVLVDSWDVLSDHYVLSWADCRVEIGKIIQKGALPAYCDAAGIRYPRTAVLNKLGDLDNGIGDLSYPVLVKPNKPASSFKTHVCRDAAALSAFVTAEQSNLPLVVQEWIEGPDNTLFSYTCLMEEGRELYGMAARKVRASPPGLGRATVVETDDDAGVRDASRKLIEVLNISGPLAMEFKRGPDGTYWFIEANVGRTEFCVDLAIQAGFNVPYLEFLQALGRPMPDINTSWRPSVWFDTDKEPLSYWALCLKQRTFRPFGKAPVFPYWGKETVPMYATALVRSIGEYTRRVAGKLKQLRG